MQYSSQLSSVTQAFSKLILDHKDLNTSCCSCLSGETQPLSLCAGCATGNSSPPFIPRLCGAVTALLPWIAANHPGCTRGFPAWGCLAEQSWLTACTRSFQVELGQKPSPAACWQRVAAVLPVNVPWCCCSVRGICPLLPLPSAELLFYLTLTTEPWFLPRTEGNPGVHTI